MNDSLDFNILDMQYCVEINYECHAYKHLTLLDNRDIKFGKTIKVSDAFKIAKDYGWVFNTESSLYKDTYFICYKLNMALGFVTESSLVYFVVGKNKNSPFNIASNMSEHQRHAINNANLANGWKSIEKDDNDAEYIESMNKFYNKLK